MLLMGIEIGPGVRINRTDKKKLNGEMILLFYTVAIIYTFRVTPCI